MMSFLEKVKQVKDKKRKKAFSKRLVQNFFLGIVYGLGQALGLTLIFALLISLLARSLSALGGVPYFGSLLANIINATQKALEQVR
jgi:hypothetical protein